MLLAILAGPSLAATLYVGPSDTYRTISSALSASASGDTIVVRQGTYAENVDLRSKNVTLKSEDGPRYTILSPTSSIQIDSGTLQGFTIDPAPTTAVYVPSGSPTVRQMVIMDPASYGVEVVTGTPTIEEVYVEGSGGHGFILRAGTGVVRRCVARDPVNYGFAIRGGTVQNSIAIGGKYGFVWETTASTYDHVVAVGASIAGTAALTSATISNGAFEDNTALLACFSGNTGTWSNGVAYNTATTSGCSGSPTSAVTNSDPKFANWSAGASTWELDFRPASGSPMIDAGSGSADTDGSASDLGAFGGPYGDWSDDDGDGEPVIFDCDDQDANTYAGAGEIADGLDNDCDDVIDEDIPIDTGGGDADTDADADTDTDT
ncbi:MAG: MopE-related protein, partial [Myxococcota bacterium]